MNADALLHVLQVFGQDSCTNEGRIKVDVSAGDFALEGLRATLENLADGIATDGGIVMSLEHKQFRALLMAIACSGGNIGTRVGAQIVDAIEKEVGL